MENLSNVHEWHETNIQILAEFLSTYSDTHNFLTGYIEEDDCVYIGFTEIPRSPIGMDFDVHRARCILTQMDVTKSIDEITNICVVGVPHENELNMVNIECFNMSENKHCAFLILAPLIFSSSK